jgi:uncharacterized protein involved in type VI secretion and phage assembly
MLCDDTAAMTHKLPAAVPFRATSSLDAGVPHVFNLRIASEVETSAVMLRDYNYEHPQLALEGKHKVGAADLFTNEADLEAYRYEVGKLKSSSEGDTSAERELDARRALSQVFTCEASFGLQPGVRLALSGHRSSAQGAHERPLGCAGPGAGR